MNLLFSGFSPEDNVCFYSEKFFYNNLLIFIQRFLLDPFNRFEQEPTPPFIELYRTDDIFFDQPSIYFHIPEHSVFPQIDILVCFYFFMKSIFMLFFFNHSITYSTSFYLSLLPIHFGQNFFYCQIMILSLAIHLKL